MARIEKTVFISYRRTDVYTALAVYESLKNQGYDVFFDYRSISSGDFEQIITANIRARAHFLLILTPTALDRCDEPGDWLRREIEFAIDEKRNIVPLLFKGFRFGTPLASEKLTGKLKNLSRYNGLNVHEDYFDEAMQRLRSQFLNIPLDTVLHPVSTEVQKVVKAEQVAADKALKQENIKELVRQAEEKPDKSKMEQAPKPVEKVPLKPVQDKPTPVVAKEEKIKHTLAQPIPYRLGAGITGLVLLISLCIWGSSRIYKSLVTDPMRAANTQSMNMTFAAQTVRAQRTDTTSMGMSTLGAYATQSAIPLKTSTPTLGIGSTMIGKDGMTLLYVPAGEFTMGSDADDALAECQKYRSDCQRDWFTDEEPPHRVNLNAFWIDQTEVTNTMYAKCVDVDVCDPPSLERSYTRDSYFSNPDFGNYPVIYVNWNMAKAYCEWVERRLPTEAEWEKAASWDQDKQEKRVYPWGDSINCSFANYFDERSKSCIGDTIMVGNYPNGASPYGALDMAGNVWEWIADWYNVYPGGDSSANSSFGQTHRVLRGGAYNYSTNLVSPADREANDPKGKYDELGFRCAMSITP